MTRLNKQDWDKLDEILSKFNYGGYYDFIEVVKSMINDLALSLYPDVKLKNLEQLKEFDETFDLLKELIYKAIDKIKDYKEFEKRIAEAEGD